MGYLWFKPVIFCIISIIGALLARSANGTFLTEIVPDVKMESIESLLNTISSSMLVISTFSVASMLSAFSAASGSATPRSFKIVVTDDASQYALSIFIGAFIFSIVATIALGNEYYDKAGRFVLFLFTLIFFAVVIITFLRWVDRISRLGRMGHTIGQVEAVAYSTLEEYVKHPYLKGLPCSGNWDDKVNILSSDIGYIQYIDMDSLQKLAEEINVRIRLNCLQGKFVHKNSILAYVQANEETDSKKLTQRINETFHTGPSRLYREDPRFGLIALTEIATRALSPGINDPGTAIQVIGTHERLFFIWNEIHKDGKESVLEYDRIEVPSIPTRDFFEDAFRPIARDGAGNIEVMLRLQKLYCSLATISHSEIRQNALEFSEEAFERAELKLEFEKDRELLKTKCLFLLES